MIIYHGTPKIETKRLILRRMEYFDAQSVFDNWISDERVTNNRVNAAHNSISESIEREAKIVSGYKTREFCYWGIELKVSDELIRIGIVIFVGLLLLIYFHEYKNNRNREGVFIKCQLL